MKRSARLAQWAVVAMAVLALFWIAASLGGWSPDVRRLTTSVHGPQVADYRAESPQILAPLSPEVTKDASQDQASAGRSRPKPGTTPSGGPSPSPSGSGPTPTASVLPTLPVPTVTLVTPTLPVPTPPPTPTLPTPPPLP